MGELKAQIQMDTFGDAKELSHIGLVENCSAAGVVRSGLTLKSMTVTMKRWLTWSCWLDNSSTAGTCFYWSSEKSCSDHGTLLLIADGNESNLSFFSLTCLFGSLA